jgi:hypothetical protein
LLPQVFLCKGVFYKFYYGQIFKMYEVDNMKFHFKKITIKKLVINIDFSGIIIFILYCFAK